MFSRYDLMGEADSLCDPEDGERFPDPLSLNYATAKFTTLPVAHRIDTGDIFKFWLHMHDVYGLTDHDDLLLNLNAVPYVGLLEPGDVIYDIAKADLEKFNQEA